MLILYPEIKPYVTHRLKVDEIHELYVEECGEPTGIPVVFFHAGPGTGISTSNRCFFDPEKYRIILFDQRGAGASTPHACIESNNTELLLSDIERIREFLSVDKWVVFGGAWGALLALLYAQSHPENILGMIVRGVFLGRENDVNWFYRHGANLIYPEYWEDFIRPLPVKERVDPVSAYSKILTGENELARMQAAKAWSLWEARCATLRPNNAVVEHFTEPHVATAMACLCCHYLSNRLFIEPDQVIKQSDKLSDIPGIIVHGRYDMVCPLDNAFALHRAWPNAELQIIRDAGHSIADPALIDGLVRSTRLMVKRLESQ